MVERITEATGPWQIRRREEREREGERGPGMSYRLGEEHEISITRLPFHQTGTLGLSSRGRKTLLGSQPSPAAMSFLTSDEMGQT